jgi:hypothetical protein
MKSNKCELSIRKRKTAVLNIEIRTSILRLSTALIATFCRINRVSAGNGLVLWDVGIHCDNHVRFCGRPAKTVPSRVRLLYTGRCVLRSG